MLKHISEPWKMEKCRCGHPACNMYTISVAGADGRFRKEDAQLICAAPDMYEALKPFANLELPIEATEPDSKIVICTCTLGDLKRATMAIAKAEGVNIDAGS